MHEFHLRYGSIVRLAPNELSFTDARAWKDIYGNRAGHLPFERNQTWFKKQTPDEPNSIMGFHEEDHARFRKIFVHAFSEKSLKDQTPTIEAYVNLLADQLRTRIAQAKGSATVDLVKWLNYTTFDISGDLSFGESFGCVKEGKPHPWVEISYDFGKGLALISSINLYPPFDKLLRYIIPKKIIQRSLDHRAMSSQKVQQRLSLDTDRPDFITAITTQNDEKNKIISVPEMEINMTILIFAGSETTASGLSGILRMLLQNKKPMATLVEEVRSTFQHDSDITIASVGRLEYMNAVINEGLRVCPPVTVGVPRLVPPGGDTVCEEWIAGGVSNPALVALHHHFLSYYPSILPSASQGAFRKMFANSRFPTRRPTLP